uniref:Uncharacterized protein n=1 Tax=Macrostomum lignano TaxID=282301 RepID=A0A1I8F559_9PLAT
MQIIHINGFMHCGGHGQVGHPFGSEEARRNGAWLLQQQMTDNRQPRTTQRVPSGPGPVSVRLFESILSRSCLERLWQDPGVQESFRNSSRYQLIDCANKSTTLADRRASERNGFSVSTTSPPFSTCATVSSFDLTLKEDVGIERPKNRLLESLDTFQEVWLNRYWQGRVLLCLCTR